jgi:hypothetical protein
MHCQVGQAKLGPTPGQVLRDYHKMRAFDALLLQRGEEANDLRSLAETYTTC